MMQMMRRVTQSAFRLPSIAIVSQQRSFTAEAPVVADAADAAPVRGKAKAIIGNSVKMMAAASAQRSFALHLYKAILLAHRRTLAHDPTMRSIGDAYVRDEFQRHKKVEAQYLHPFFDEWLSYLAYLKTQSEATTTMTITDEDGVERHIDSNGVISGRTLTDEQRLTLNEEQLKQLQDLQTESTKVQEMMIESEADAAKSIISPSHKD